MAPVISGGALLAKPPLSQHVTTVSSHYRDRLSLSGIQDGVTRKSSFVHLLGRGSGKSLSIRSVVTGKGRTSILAKQNSFEFAGRPEDSDGPISTVEAITATNDVVVSSPGSIVSERNDSGMTASHAGTEIFPTRSGDLKDYLTIWDKIKQIWPALLPSGAMLGLADGLEGLNLEGPGSVLEAMGVLAMIVTVHECGHFLAARVQNIHVTKFSIGFGPILGKFQGKSVEYTLRAIPLGGFVAFPDDDPESEFASDDPDLLKNRPLLDRAFVISAGVLANVVFAYTVLFTQVNTVGVLEQTFSSGVLVAGVVENSAAARGGLQKNDVVLGVDGRPLLSEQSSVLQLVEAIKTSVGQPIHFDLLRGEENVSLDVVPDKTSDGSGRIGVQLAPNASTNRVKASGLGQATELASEEFGRLLETVVDGLKQIVFNFSQTADKVSGPVAIVAVGAEVARSDIAGLFQFAAIVNLNLAVVNILPLPALDGGYLMLLLIEALRGGRKLPSGLEQGIMSSGLLLLLGVGVALMVRDTLNLGFLEGIL